MVGVFGVGVQLVRLHTWHLHDWHCPRTVWTNGWRGGNRVRSMSESVHGKEEGSTSAHQQANSVRHSAVFASVLALISSSFFDVFCSQPRPWDEC